MPVLRTPEERFACLPNFPFASHYDVLFRRLIPSARQQPRIKIQDAGHFLQEEKGEEIAQHIIEFVRQTPVD